jgi:N-[(2S)-2-amino-2-carboxyethyl]-L-glutamate dehydrogenase
MKIITEQQVKDLHISPSTCVEWIKESFALKSKAQLPAKISLHPQGMDLFNTMPCIIPEPYNYFGVKIGRRILGAVPSVMCDFLLYNTKTGELLALFDADWITAMRTGAVATLAAQTFRKQDTQYYGLIGLGNTARATLLCLLDSEPNIHHKVHLLKYKNQAELFIQRFETYNNVEFDIIDNAKDLVANSDVIISCVTEANELICDDNSLFQEGVTVIPVHTRGFQNCDLFFDKVFADDTNHVKGFKYFSKFRYFAEMSEILYGGGSEGYLIKNAS